MPTTLSRRGSSVRLASAAACAALVASLVAVAPGSGAFVALASDSSSPILNTQSGFAPSIAGHNASSDAQLLPSPVKGRAGKRIKFVGFNFGATEDVTITFVDAVTGKTLLGTFTTDADGVCFGIVTIPKDATAGRQKLQAYGTTSHDRDAAKFRVK